MNFSGSEIIPAAREAVWNGLNSPEILQRCIPGCQSITQDAPGVYSAKLVAKLGPVKATFTGMIHVSESKPPESYRIAGQGQGGLAGFASASARIKLTALSAHETQLDYEAEAQIGGRLALLGSRLMAPTATSYVSKFFAIFAGLINAPA